MKKCIILVTLFFCYLSFLNAGQRGSKEIEQPSSQNVTVQIPDNSKTVIIENKPVIAPTFNNHASAESKSISSSKAYNYLANQVITMVKMIQEIKTADISSCLQKNLWAYKWYILSSISTITYLGLCTFLIYGNYYLKEEKNWIKWKHHLSMQELHNYLLDEIKKRELMHNLIDAILTQYRNPKDPTNPIQPLVQFSVNIDREIQYLTFYLQLARVLSVSRLIKIFPTNETKIEQAREGKKRLEFIKQLFIAWSVQYNSQQFFQPATPPIAGASK